MSSLRRLSSVLDDIHEARWSTWVQVVKSTCLKLNDSRLGNQLERVGAAGGGVISEMGLYERSSSSRLDKSSVMDVLSV